MAAGLAQKGEMMDDLNYDLMRDDLLTMSDTLARHAEKARSASMLSYAEQLYTIIMGLETLAAEFRKGGLKKR